MLLRKHTYTHTGLSAFAYRNCNEQLKKQHRPAAFATPTNWNGVLVPGFLANGTFIPFPLQKLQIQIAIAIATPFFINLLAAKLNLTQWPIFTIKRSVYFTPFKLVLKKILTVAFQTQETKSLKINPAALP